MFNDTTLLLNLDGVSVVRVKKPAGGRRRIHLATADEMAGACPACGVFATRVNGSAVTRPEYQLARCKDGGAATPARVAAFRFCSGRRAAIHSWSGSDVRFERCDNLVVAACLEDQLA